MATDHFRRLFQINKNFKTFPCGITVPEINNFMSLRFIRIMFDLTCETKYARPGMYSILKLDSLHQN